MFRKIAKTALHAAAVGVLLSGLSLQGINAAAAEERREPSTPGPGAEQGLLLQTREIDVTGDGNPELVALGGTKADAAGSYFSRLFVVVTGGQGRNQVVIPLQGGHNPNMRFCDFNGDKLPEIYVSAETGGSGGASRSHIYSLQNNVPTALPVPEPLRVTAKFKHNYVVKLKIEETGKSFKIDLKEKKQDYDQSGVYKNGMLVKPFLVSVNPYSDLQTMDADQDGVCELKGVQRIAGMADADTLGYALSIWKWKEGKWALVSSKVKKSL